MIVLVSAPLSVVSRIVIDGGNAGTRALNASDTLDSLNPGMYNLTAYRCDKYPGQTALTGEAYNDTMPVRQVTVAPGENIVVHFNYTTLPASGKLWVADNVGSTVNAYSCRSIATLGVPSPVDTINFSYAGPHALVFDSLGFLYVAAFESNKIFVFSPNQLHPGASQTPYRTLSAPQLDAPYGIAFDNNKTLWMSNWSTNLNTVVGFRWGTVLKALLDTQSVLNLTPDIVIASSMMVEPQFIAFDAQGNLWVTSSAPGSNQGEILKFDASKISASGQLTPSVVISEKDTNYIGVNGLTFDKAGNLWGTETTAFFKLDASQIMQSGSPAPSYVGACILPGTLVFDATGALWICDNETTIKRFVPGSIGNPIAYIATRPGQYPTGLVFFPQP